ncbi:hypothetical protein M427DRAFT_34842 [Gonapodya prolifera JEL478]|uniref:G-protein coupled receptors family 1 profile domain-containing protein n=1 Tax=Gonapodya prolifera (strain JEL478) TaxID=1344416 RepID=A0A139A6K1_GONPJ|nr:hypothetical protein M427DRAFT_34842 [Gonapodya prolifera JEL478]|eukprot:KXS12279.1 hypothetical protein M427DRAFT_34842 [Gonapodya prolifera JEL478]
MASDGSTLAPPDTLLDLQIFTNGTLLATAVAQLLIIFTFLQEWRVLPAQLRYIGLSSLVPTIISCMLAMAGNCLQCFPFVEAGCYVFNLGRFASWLTYILRIWALSRHNRIVTTTCFGALLVAMGARISFCATLVSYRSLPRLCNPAGSSDINRLLNILSAVLSGAYSLFLATVHLYYLHKNGAEALIMRHNSARKNANLNGGASGPGARAPAPGSGRVGTTVRMMAKGVMVLVVDAVMQVFGKLTSLISPSYFFITFWSGQLLIDILYVLYIKSFAVELRGSPRNYELNLSAPAGGCRGTPPRPGIGSPESPVKSGFPVMVTGFEPLGVVTALGRGGDGVMTVQMSRAIMSAMGESDS